MAHTISNTLTKPIRKTQAVRFRANLILPVLGILLIMLCLLPFSSSTRAAGLAQAPESPVKISLRPFYGGFYQDGKWSPVEVTLENQSDQPFVGEVRTTLPINANSADSTFARPVNIGAKTTERLVFYILVNQRPPGPIPVTLYDRQQREVARDNVRLQIYATSDYVVGMLADENLPLTFPRLTSVTLRANSFRVVPYKVEPKDVTDRQESLDVFHALIVGDVSPDKLSDTQRRTILAWVGGGGQLIFAGTSKLEANLLALTPDGMSNLAPVQINGQATLSRFNLQASNLENAFVFDAAQAVPFNRLIPTKNAYVSIQQFNETEPPMMVTRSFGKGSFSVMAVDPLNSALLNGSYVRQWWGLIIDNGLPALDYAANNQNLFSQAGVSNILLNLPSPNQPSPLLFLLAIGAYIILVVPVTYLGLWRLGRVELAWAVIPGLAIIFGLSMMWAVSLLPVGDVYLSRINLVMATEDEAPAGVESFVLVSSANEDPYKLTLNGSSALVRPQFLSATNPSQNAALPPDLITQNSDSVTLQSLSEGRGRLQVFGSEGWQNLSTPFETRLQIQDDEMIAGTILNKSQLTVREAVLVYGDNYLPLGDWLPGEEKRVNFALRLKPNFLARTNVDPSLYRSPASVASLINATPTPIATFSPLPTPGIGFSPGEGASGETQTANVKWMIFNTAFLNGRFTPSYRVNNLYLAGWLDNGVIGSAMSVSERRTVQQDFTMLVKPLPLSYVAEGGKAIVPSHTLMPDRIVDMSRSTFGGYNLGNSQQMVLQYRLPAEINSPKFQPTVVSILLNSYRDQDRRNITPANIWRGRWADPIEAGSYQNNPKVEMYNWETNDWETIAPQGDTRARIDVSRPDLGAFVAPYTGYVRVRLSVNNETIFLGQVNLAVKGNYQP
jgi:hypothetical protein